MKFNNMLLLFVILFISILSLSMVSANDVNDIAISNDGGNFTELQNIVKDGGIISLDKNYVAVENENAITISKNTTINGNYNLIDAKGYCGIFNVANGVTLTLNNLTLQNAYSFGNGGAINTNNSNIVLKGDMAFINNNAVNGGAIYSESSISIDCENIKFINNTAYNGWGGAIHSQQGKLDIDATNLYFYNNNALYNGGGIYTNGSVLNIKSKYAFFENNKASWAGGAIYSRNNIIIEGDKFEFNNNFAKEYGGAICVFGKDGVNISVSKILFDSNIAMLDGGAICSGYANINANTINFTNNKATGDECGGGALDIHHGGLDLKAIKIIFENNKASRNGGAILFESNNYNMIIDSNNINFFNNSADNGGSIFTNGNLTITNAMFENNHAEYYGGAIYSNKTNLLIKDSYFIKNDATEGGAIFIYYSQMTFRHAIFKFNYAHNGSGVYAYSSLIHFDYCVFDDNYAFKSGAIGLFKKSQAFIVESKFLNNYAIDGSAVVVGGGSYCNVVSSIFENNLVEDTGIILIIYGSVLDIADSSFRNNKAINGAAISVEYNSNATIDGICCINNNAATGGAIDAYDNCFIKITDSVFNNNNARNGGAININVNCYLTISNSKFLLNNGSIGGAILISGNSEMNLSLSEFINSYGIKGGAIGIDDNSKAIIVYTNFKNNYGTTGGAIRVSNNSKLYLGDINLIGNKGFSGAGIAVVSNSSANLYNTLFKSNYGSDGGAIFCDNDSLISIRYSLFYNNEAFNGGAILNFGNLNIEDCKFEDNVANFGGAICIAYSVVYIDNSIFENNYANGCGGAIGVYYNASLNLNNVSFIANTALRHGGAIESGSYLNINSCDFSKNKAKLCGAIYQYGNVSVIINSIFNNNYATSYGGAIGIDKSIAYIYSSIFVNNKEGDDFNASIVNYNSVLYLNENNIDNIIFNHGGFINSKTNLKILNNETVAPGESVMLKALLTDDNGNVIHDLREITFNVDGTLINGTLKNPAIFKTDVIGIHVVSAKYAYANETKQTVESGFINVEDSYKLTVNDLIKYYGGMNTLIISLTKAGAPVVGEKVTISINGQTYTRTTDEDGEINFSINLNVGNYTATVNYKDLTEEANVVVLSTIYGEDIVKTYQNDTQYYAYFTDCEGNPLVNTYVTFNINGVFYTRSTDDNGIARLNINLLPGEYTLTAYNPETGQSSSNNIKVLPILVGNDLTKTTNEKAAYEVTVYNSQGKVLAGADIAININGVIYHKITNSNGVARLNINLNLGEYIATVYYNGFSTSNKINVI